MAEITFNKALVEFVGQHVKYNVKLVGEKGILYDQIVAMSD